MILEQLLQSRQRCQICPKDLRDVQASSDRLSFILWFIVLAHIVQHALYEIGHLDRVVSANALVAGGCYAQQCVDSVSLVGAM